VDKGEAESMKRKDSRNRKAEQGEIEARGRQLQKLVEKPSHAHREERVEVLVENAPVLTM
jgi:hypothetical protein